ncbi:MAG: agmatine deiminase family protein, partial [Pseudomonadota bacterium]
QIAAFANAVATSGQEVRLLVRDEANAARARELVSDAVLLEQRIYGDIWLRDTGPLVVFDAGMRAARRFAFNGWGVKYEMPGDESIGSELAQASGLTLQTSAMVLEGGALDGDGTGRALTTEQCLLNHNRNPELSQEDIEAELKRQLGLSEIIWLGDGLINDHTDGHVDNLARFVAPGRVVIPQASVADDPNAGVYHDAAHRAQTAGLEVVRIPSPGRIERDGQIEPASYVNFAITSQLVAVPVFGSPNDTAGVAAIAAQFPDRDTIGLPADAVLAGGGGFHCASQQMPSAPAD